MVKESAKKRRKQKKKLRFVRSIAYDTTKYTSRAVFSILKIIIAIIVVISFTVGGVVIGSVAAYINTAPTITDDQLKIETLDLTTFIHDREGAVIAELHGAENINRVIVPYNDLPQNLINSFIAIEDERFLTHNGIDLRRISSAVLGLILPGIPSHGGSTITQQMIRNLTGEFKTSIERKVQEWWRAIQLERKLDKWQIMELYVNIIYMGEGAYGVQAASLVYFNKNVWDLSLAESASLAGITNSPALFNPLYKKSREANIRRQQAILEKMLELGHITENEYENAKKEKLVFNTAFLDQRKEKPLNQQSYFIDRVVIDVKKDLMETLNISENLALDMIYSKGLQIYTTQDTSLQDEMTRIFNDPDNFPVKSDLHSQAAMVIMDPWNGQVLALYGGYGEKKGNAFNRATQMRRQPGSAFKPIAVYGPAIDRGYITPATVINDAPSYMETKKPDDIYPKNYDSDGYEGLVTIRRAIQSSINTVAAKVWTMIPDISLMYLRRVNIQRNDERYISLALGGLNVGVSVLDMTASFQPFINQGMYFEPVTYTKVLNSEGRVLLDKTARSNVVFEDERTSFIMTSMMKDVVTRGTAYPYGILKNSEEEIIPTAGKTGTSSDYYDKWFVGYSPYYVSAVWYGYDLNTTLVRDEYRVAQDLWNKVMMFAHKDKIPIDFQIPEGLVEVEIDGWSGMLPSELSSHDPRGARIIKEFFISGTEPYTVDNLHIEVDLCTASMDDFGRAKLALPWCPEDEVITKVKIDKPEKFEIHINEDGTNAAIKQSDYPRDLMHEAVSEYCTAHPMPDDWDGPIPEGFLPQE